MTVVQNDPVSAAITAVLTRWDDGELSGMEVVDALFEVAAAHGFDAVLDRLEEPWRQRLFSYPRDCALAPADTEWVRIGRLRDPSNRTWENELLPAIRHWWAGSPRGARQTCAVEPAGSVARE